MDYITFLNENFLILVPVLLIVGKLLKNTPVIKDWTIPYFLLAVGVALAFLISGLDVDALMQGVIATGVAVFSHQVFKQTVEKE